MKLYSDTVQTFFDMYLQSEFCEQLVEVTEESSAKSDLVVFPNPAQNTAVIRSIGRDIGAIRIINVIGESVLSIENINTNQISIDVANFSSGIYLIQILKENEKATTAKLVVE